VATNDTISLLLALGSQRLAQASETPRLDAELLLCHALGVNRTWLVTHESDAPDAQRYHHFIERRASGEPLAYIVGFKDFWTLRLAVTPAVLVPRPETELLVERALAAMPHNEVKRVVDLGTGSGAIALALASERPRWEITAVDASAEALAVARANALALELTQVELLRGSWFEPLAGRRFDLIVSNPPYIARSDAALETPGLLHEPHVALSPGADALACLCEIIHDAPQFLERGGWLLLEHGATQAEQVADELVARGFHHVTSRRDLAGHERVTEAQWP
jgi:release factor glutamine methyltransferase